MVHHFHDSSQSLPATLEAPGLMSPPASPLTFIVSSLLNDAKEQASATDAGREIQIEVTRGNKLHLQELVLTEHCLN